MIRAKTTRRREGDEREVTTLYLAFELGRAQRKLGFTTGMGQRPWERTVSAGDLDALEAEIDRARRRFGLPLDVQVMSCYEAGRDGFWLHRFLEAVGHRNHVVDSSSIEVNRRARRAKTDSLDLAGLLRLLIRYDAGERKVWSVVRVPSPEAEDARIPYQHIRWDWCLRRTRSSRPNETWCTGSGTGSGWSGSERSW